MQDEGKYPKPEEEEEKSEEPEPFKIKGIGKPYAISGWNIIQEAFWAIEKEINKLRADIAELKKG